MRTKTRTSRARFASENETQRDPLISSPLWSAHNAADRTAHTLEITRNPEASAVTWGLMLRDEARARRRPITAKISRVLDGGCFTKGVRPGRFGLFVYAAELH